MTIALTNGWSMNDGPGGGTGARCGVCVGAPRPPMIIVAAFELRTTVPGTEYFGGL